MNEIIKTVKVLFGLDLKGIFPQYPGLMDRGVMLGIPTEVSFQILAGLIDLLPTTDTTEYPDVYTRDILLDVIGYYEEDWRGNRYPGIDEFGTQQYYEEGMIMAAVLARRLLPTYTYEVTWSGCFHSEMLYLVVLTNG